ncbi:MAG: hypothetical protein U5Q16_05470 [Gammaproteobacteria bacterium]|nr:hypothetical protein [Gammaproteobacteria bacterium]
MTRADAAMLNESCFCVSVDVDAVWGELLEALDPDPGMSAVRETHAGLFSNQAVFMAREDVQAMQAVVAAVESVVAMPAYRAAALADAPAIAAQMPGAPAVLHGFDFHLGPDGPQLIEINTNAGGMTLAAALPSGLEVPCGSSEGLGLEDRTVLNERLWRMFVDVWRRRRGTRPLQHIAIVDEQPQQQYLYPEFLLFRALFRSHGVTATIAAPEDLDFTDGSLRVGGHPVDLVYNRLTDFYLQTPQTRALRDAALADAVVLTPDPAAHAIYASKRNLARLTDPATLASWGVPASVADTLRRGIPATQVVRAQDAESLWAARKQLFFKPAWGYGSRGSYRGDKLTRGRFQDILDGDYVAQALMAPGARAPDPANSDGWFKFDVRSYVYDGQSLMLAARLYRGQTTNFRSAGGGFAPVLRLPEGDWRCPDGADSRVVSAAAADG